MIPAVRPAAKDANMSDSPETSAPRDVEEIGREVIASEIRGLQDLRRAIGPEFRRAVAMLLECRGKVIVCGIGKSGIAARKIAATLSSTGTPAVYLHAVDAAHGDMGMITKEDVFLAVSKSGKNDEVAKLIPFLKTLKVKMIAITASPDSPLAVESDLALFTMALREACPMDIVPTTSTTSAIVLGDALAVAALQSRNFGREDFARLHPSGILGKRLNLTVGELMHKGEALPAIGMDTYGRSGRGYNERRFRGERLIYGELEYRASLTRNGLIGVVAFMNTLTLANAETGEQLFDAFAPAGGIGLRVLFNKRSRTNLCIDYAWGRQGAKGFYLGLQEAF